MAGIYIHIPFCKQKCHYCNFFSMASLKYKDGFLKALKQEIEIQQNYLAGQSIDTIYLGGGTPSILSPSETQAILDPLYRFFDVSEKAEITLEANPDDLTKAKLAELKTLPINRLSIGVQSFFDDDLKYLHRIHDGAGAIASIKDAQDAGFSNLTMDLIYGIPTLNESKWNKNLDAFFSLGLPHLSAYALTVERKTALQTLILKRKLAPTDELQAIEHFKILTAKMQAADFVHYEISNFAKAGFYSKHNSIYWMGGHYLGLGPSAHSFNGESRQWNAASISKYLNLKDYQEKVVEKEILSWEQKYDEYVMTSLRTVWGCDLEHIENVFGQKMRNYCEQNSTKFISENKIRKEGNKLFLTELGKLFADGIASELFWEEG
jgi:putative oxygen-independent coproporphyrinogen III oxidase